MSQDLEGLIQALLQGNEPDPALRLASTQLLAHYQSQPNYYSYLVHIFASSPQEINLGPHALLIRLQAAIQFKNGIDKYWRRGAPNAIPLAEKQAIRPRLLQLVNEPDRVLAKTVAICIGKIARLDYGTDWDELPSSLLASLQAGLANPDPILARLVLHRTLLILNETVKSLSSNRLLKGRVIMSNIAGILFSTLVQLHNHLLATAAKGLAEARPSETGTGAVEDIELGLLAFKTLSKFFLNGFKNLNEDLTASNFFHSLLATLTTLHNLRLAVVSRNPTDTRLPFLTRHVIQFGKLYRSVLRTNGEAFAKFGMTNQIVEFYWSVLQGASVDVKSYIIDSTTAPYPERFVVQALLLISATLGDWSSGPPTPPRPELPAQLVNLVVTKFLPMRQEDLQKWSDDPEEWMNDEEADRWEFELRPCAEHVFQSLLGQYSDVLAPLMANLLREASAAVPQNMDGLLLKEGVYCAFGRCPAQLNSSIDFSAWLEHSLLPEAASTDPSFVIIRRRIAWLVGNWLAEDLPVETRARICSLLVHLLSNNPSTDPAIRLTAARSLGKLCGEWTFDPESFLPFLPTVVEQIEDLLATVELQDSKMRLNETLGSIIERVPEHISPYVPRLVGMLSSLWASSEENHFQVSVLITLTKIAENIGEQSQALHAQACPIIQYSSDPSHHAHIYLQEDALQLWLILIRRSSVVSPEMLNLLPTLVTLLKSGTDVLPRVLSILESYLLLDAAGVLQLCVNDLFVAFEDLLGDLKVDAARVILHALDTIFQTAPVETWAAALEGSGAFIKLLYPLKINESAVIVTKHLCSMSRIILAGPETFHQLIQATAARMNVALEEVWQLLMSAWFDHFDNMGQAEHRKLTALAMANLLPSTNPIILSRLGELFSLLSSVLAERAENTESDVIPEDHYDAGFDYTETLETTRRRELMNRDPVFKLKTATLIRQKLAEAEALNGGSAAFQAKYFSGPEDLVMWDELARRLNGSLVG